MSCEITGESIESFKEYVGGKAIDYVFGDISNDLFKLDIISYINENIKGQGYNLSEDSIKRTVAEELVDTMVGAGANDSSFLTIDNMINLLSSDVAPVTDAKTVTTDQRFGVQETRRTNYEDVLESTFGTAFEVRNAAVKEANSYMINAMFINTGMLNNGEKGGVISKPEDMNNNIRNYLEYLFKKSCQGIRDEQLADEERAIVQNPQLFKDGKSTGQFDIIKEALDRQLNPSLFSSSMIREMYKEYRNGTNNNIKSYIAWNLLTHFDSYVKWLYGDSITIIKDRGRLSGADKYQLANKNAAMNSHWRTDENFDPGSEIDNITKLLVETIPIYLKGCEQPTDRYLTFLNFLNIIAKIKEISYFLDAQQIVFNDDYMYSHEKFRESISQETLDFIKDKSLMLVICSIRQNSRKNLHHVIEVVSNAEFLANNQNIFGEKNQYTRDRLFTEEEFNHLYTINKRLFSNDSNTIRTLVGKNAEIDYYHYITQTCDSIFKNSFILYYVDEDGLIRTRILTDLSLYNQLQRIVSRINANNSNSVVANYASKLEQLNLEPLGESEVTFTIPNTNIVVTANFRSEGVTYRKGNLRLEVENMASVMTDGNVVKFLDSVLSLGLQEDSNYFKVLSQISNGRNIAAKNLLDFASRIIANQYVSVTKLKDLSGARNMTERKRAINNFFGNTNITFERSLGLINLVSKSSTNINILSKLATVRSILDGQAMSTQVKDSQQASLNLQSLSRLLGSWSSQVALIEKAEDSVTKDLTLLNTPGLFRGHFTTSEFYDKLTQTTKKATKFSVGELAYANIVTNFLEGLTENKDSYDFISNNLCAFYASVNSDKNTIGELLFDLNKQINGKRIIDFTNTELLDIISKDFGKVYTNIVENIESDFARLQEYARGVFNDNSINFSNDYVNNFRGFNRWCYNKGFDPQSTLKGLVKKYNTTHRLKPIELVNDIHYQLGKKVNGFTPLAASDTLLSLVYRYNPLYLNNLVINETKTLYRLLDQYVLRKFAGLSILMNFPSFVSEFETGFKNFGRVVPQGMTRDLFRNQLIQEALDFYGIKLGRINQPYIKFLKDTKWDAPQGCLDLVTFFTEKSRLMFRSLVDNGFEYNLESHPDSGATKYLKNIDPKNEWIDSSGKMIIGKIEYGGQYYNVTSRTDIYLIAAKGLIADVNKCYERPIKLNPMLSKYNLLDFWLTQSWMNTTVGSFISHPAKGSDPLIREASQYNAQHKRNVSMTALMHEFSLNVLNGITEEYNIAVIDDIKDFQSILGHTKAKITPYDGTTFVNPFTVYLENNSLAGAKAGFDKKQFVHFKNGRFGNGGIIKTAGFGITNDRLRNSPDGWYPMMYKMTHHQWLDKNGVSPFIATKDVNITKKWDGTDIYYNDIYYRKGEKYYKITGIQHIEGNLYKVSTEEVNSHGDTVGIVEPRTETIDNNYALWKVLGAEWSMEMRGDKANLQLVPSERSISKIVEVMNKMGLIKEKSPGVNYSINEVETQEELWQPMKYSDVQYLVTKGAIKHGSANVSSNNLYKGGEDLDILRIKMYQAGIQLDKEHHADDAELSLPTLIVTACAALGYTLDIADALYRSLAYRADVSLGKFQDAVNKYETDKSLEAKDEMSNLLYKLIIKAASTSDGFIRAIAKEAEKKVDIAGLDYKDIDFPLSDNTVFNKMISTVTSTMSKQGIRLKIPGVLAVLTPSFDLFKLYGNKKFDSFKNPNVELEEMQQKAEANPIYSKYTEVPVLFKSGDINGDINLYLLPENEKVEYEEVDKPWRDDPTRFNKSVRIYLKDSKDKGYFEVVKDDEDSFYSIHFKPKDSNNPNAFTLKEKDILFKAAANVIPNGARLSTHGEISRGGLRGLSRFTELGFTQEGTRILNLKYDRTTNNISNIELGRKYKIVLDGERERWNQNGIRPTDPVKRRYYDLGINAFKAGIWAEAVNAVIQRDYGNPFSEKFKNQIILKILDVNREFSESDLLSYFDFIPKTTSKNFIDYYKNIIIPKALLLYLEFIDREFPNIYEMPKSFRGKEIVYLENPEDELLGLKDVVFMDNDKFYIDLNTAREVYNSLNSTESFDDFITELLNNEIRISNHKQRFNESDEEYRLRFTLEVDNFNNALLSDATSGDVQYFEVKDVDDYRELKNLIWSGKVKRVTEWVKDGRNLGAYNVRFTTHDGSRFLLWDLDSIECLQSLLKLKDDGNEDETALALVLAEHGVPFTHDPEGRRNLDWYLKNFRRRVQHDLEILSDHVEDKMELYKKVLASNDEKALDNWLKINLTTSEYQQWLKSGKSLQYAGERVDSHNKVKIRNKNGEAKLYYVDKTSLDILAYEAIMPKRYIEEFGFNEFTDLDEVKNDEDWFLKQYLRVKNQGRVSNNQFDVELNSSNGDHFYIIRRSRLSDSGLHKSNDELLIDLDTDGKFYRYDATGENILYEMPPEITDIYVDDATGKEVLVIDDSDETQCINLIKQYISSVKFDTINVSPELKNSEFVINLLDEMVKLPKLQKKFKSRILHNRELVREKTDLENQLTYSEVIDKLNSIFEITTDNYKEKLDEYDYLTSEMREKHTSFLKSLDIVAARIPSQSLQSFMPMKVVAFDNPNRNSAYVSNLQILLLGSKKLDPLKIL